MFDSHCHLDAGAYDLDRPKVLARARAAGLQGIFVPGCEPEQWRRLPSFCAGDALLSFGLGLHPWHVAGLSFAELDGALFDLPGLIATTPCVAIGECGLDGRHAKQGGASIEVQKAVLRVHLGLARSACLPLVLHCVGAHGPLLELLEEFGPLARGGVMHSYSGPAELVPRYAALGLSFSFANIVARPEAKRPRRALLAVPLDRLLVESDGPGHAQRSPDRSRPEPCDVRHVLEAVAFLRAEPLSAVMGASTRNALALFGCSA